MPESTDAQKELRLELVRIATSLVCNSDNSGDHTAEIIKSAKNLEAYVVGIVSGEDEQAESRRKFLQEIATNSSCGRGKEDCDGSEGSCTC